jgi:hypothetical protein
VYKDNTVAACCRRDHLLRQVTPLPDAVLRLYAVRQGRTWAGGVGIASFLVMIVDLAAGGRHSSTMLVCAWAAMGVAYLVAKGVSRWHLCRAARHLLIATDDVFDDLARLQAGSPQEVAVRRAHRLEVLSFALPMVALTLITPLFVHLVIGTAVLGVNIYQFSAWVLISLLLVGHAHLTLLILSVMHVLRIREELNRGGSVAGASRGFWALLWTVAASSIPGAVLLCIPPILVALTGLLFVPWMFHWVGQRARAERALLDANGLVV